MDGSGRKVIHSNELIEPSAITIDIPTQKLYWIDVLKVIDCSNIDGTNRRRLHANLMDPQGITVEGSILYWTDSGNSDNGVIHFLH